jgi:chromosome segregation ATPase
MDLAAENEELRLQLHLSTEYIEDVTAIIDQVQRNLQHIRDREGIMRRISLSADEGNRSQAVNVRRELISSISDIDAYLLDNRRKMELLAQRIQESTVRIESLEKMAYNLEMTVKKKEQDIVVLKEQVSSLEASIVDLEGQIAVKDRELENRQNTIAEQAEAIRDREDIIREQEQAAATAYVVVDSRDELKRKGLIIEERSGFLGLGRTTKVGSVAVSHFEAVPKSAPQIALGPEVQDVEIVSVHKDRPDLFTILRSPQGAQLSIKDTRGFWALSEYLIVVATN